MKQTKRTPARPDADPGPESVLPGQRSGEGVDDLFRHIARDERRKAGLGRRAPLEDAGGTPAPDKGQGGPGAPATEDPEKP